MNKELKQQIYATLTGICGSVYYQQAPDSPSFPYIVYTLEQITQDEGLHKMELEVNILDYGTNTEGCENKLEQVLTAFNKKYFLGTSVQFASWVNRWNPVFEEDRKIIRRRVLIELDANERG